MVGVAVLILGGWTLARQLRTQPCLGYSEPSSDVAPLSRVWQLPVVARPRVIEARVSKGWMMSYPSSGHSVYELGELLVILDWTQAGNDAHSLGPRKVRLSLAPKEGTWGDDHRPVYEATEYVPVDTELRYDAASGSHVLIVFNANTGVGGAPPKGALLPARGGKEENRGFVFRVTHHPSGHRLAAGKLVLAGALAYLLGILALGLGYRERKGPALAMSAVGFASAALLFAFAWA